jgi:NADPH:quinone reductase-like Zn-dependent oxidoreductase
MKAIFWTNYGPPDVLQLRNVEKPAPDENEVLIRIYSTTVTAGDCEQRSMQMPFWFRFPLQAYVGLRRPVRITVLGMDFAGEIEAAGKDVKRFRAGDQVFGTSGIRFSTNAEYICLPEEPNEGALGIKPANMTYEEAAAVPVGGIEALHFLRQGDVQSGQKVLINGAGGTIGPFAIQLAKHFGAKVTAVDGSEKLDMLRSIGADSVIDYTHEEFTKSDETYDFILDVVSKSSFSGSLGSLNQNGRYLIANPRLSQMVRGRWNSIRNSLPGLHNGKKVIFGAARPNNEDLNNLKELIEAGSIVSVIDRTYPLEQIPEAHKYVESGQKKGQVVITVAHANNK